MASICKRVSARTGKIAYQSIVRSRGRNKSRRFRTKKEAKPWGEMMEGNPGAATSNHRILGQF